MLSSLFIQDFVLIDQARLKLAQGMTVLTGETGAGKSILLDALGLAVGGRSLRHAVRRGAQKGQVVASFEVSANHPVWRLLAQNDIELEDDQIILRRVQNVDGRGRAYVNDQPVSIALLRKIGGALLEIHGQHDGHGFLSPSMHREMLDEFAGLGGEVRALAKIWRSWQDVAAELEERKRERDANAREADYLSHVVEELTALSPQIGEEETLAARRAQLMAAQKVQGVLASALHALSENGIESAAENAQRYVGQASAALPDDDDALEQAQSRIDAALEEAMQARDLINQAAQRFAGGERELDDTEERLFALRGAARKHGVTPDGLVAFCEKADRALSELALGESAFDNLQAELAKLKAEFFGKARELSSARSAAAARLDKAVAAELAPLKLGGAQFKTQVVADEAAPSAHGIDQTEFLIATNPGAPLGAIKAIASGGELSRFVLALKAALAAKEDRTVIIFDEVDAGVGGAVADAVGERLARLAANAQVLVVTHSPQVAARARSHWHIEKHQQDDASVTNVHVLSDDQRVEEIARMLSGAEITAPARATAQQLLNAGTAKKSAAKPHTKSTAKRTTKKKSA